MEIHTLIFKKSVTVLQELQNNREKKKQIVKHDFSKWYWKRFLFDCVSNVWVVLKYWKHDIHFHDLWVIRGLAVEMQYLEYLQMQVTYCARIRSILSENAVHAMIINLCVYWPRAITRETSTDIIYLSIGRILWTTDRRRAHPTNSNTASGGENLHLTEGFNWCKICY